MLKSQYKNLSHKMAAHSFLFYTGHMPNIMSFLPTCGPHVMKSLTICESLISPRFSLSDRQKAADNIYTKLLLTITRLSTAKHPKIPRSLISFVSSSWIFWRPGNYLLTWQTLFLPANRLQQSIPASSKLKFGRQGTLTHLSVVQKISQNLRSCSLLDRGPFLG